MKRLLTLCLASAVVVCIYIAHAAAGMEVEGEVRDASGKVLLGESIPESDIPKLVQYLVEGGAEAEDSRGILVKFGEKAAPEILKNLPELIKNIESGKGADNVVYVLTRVTDDSLIAPLSNYINDPEPRVATSISGVLVGYGDLVLPRMLELLDDPERHDAALGILSRISPSESKLKLVRAHLTSDDAVKRSDALRLLGIWRDKLSEEAVIRLMDDKEPSVRRSAIRAYAELYRDAPDKYDAGLLIKELKDPDVEVRAAATEALSRMDDDRVVPTMMGLLETEKEHVVLASAITALSDRKVEEAAFPILKLLDKNDPDKELFQTVVIYALGELKAKEAAPYLMEMFKGGEPVEFHVRQEAFDALAKIGEPVDLSLLLKYLEPGDIHHNSTNQLLGLLEAQAKHGDKKVIDALKEFRKHASAPQTKMVDRILKRIQ